MENFRFFLLSGYLTRKLTCHNYRYFSDKSKPDKDEGHVIQHLNDDQKALVIRYGKDIDDMGQFRYL